MILSNGHSRVSEATETCYILLFAGEEQQPPEKIHGASEETQPAAFGFAGSFDCGPAQVVRLFDFEWPYLLKKSIFRCGKTGSAFKM